MTITIEALPSTEAMAANVRAFYSRASDSQIAEGMGWYRFWAKRIARLDSENPARAMAIFAILSPLNPLDRNWELTQLVYSTNGQLSSGYFKKQLAKARAIHNGEMPAIESSVSKSPVKTVAFFRNLMGDENAVTIDSWMLSAVFNYKFKKGDKFPSMSSVRNYNAIAEAVRIVAAELDIAPRELQAIVWIVVREMWGK